MAVYVIKTMFFLVNETRKQLGQYCGNRRWLRQSTAVHIVGIVVGCVSRQRAFTLTGSIWQLGLCRRRLVPGSKPVWYQLELDDIKYNPGLRKSVMTINPQ